MGVRAAGVVGPGATTRLSLLLGAALALLLGAVALALWRDHADTLDDGRRAIERGALGAAQHAGRSLAVARLLADRIESDLQRGGPDRFLGAGWREFAAFNRNAPEVGSLWIIGADGMLRATTLAPDPPRVDLSSRPFFAPLRDGAQSYLLPLSWGVVTRAWFFAVNHAVRDAEGRFAGVVQAALHADDFARAYAEFAPGAQARVLLLRLPDAQPLMLWPQPPPGGEVLVPAPMPQEAQALAAAARGGARSGEIDWRALDGARWLVAWHRLSRDEDDMIAAVAVPRAAVLEPYRQRRWRTLLVGLIGAVVLVGLGLAVADAQARGAATEARFRGTFDQAAVGMAHVGLDGGWIRVNGRLCAMLGYTEAELLALRFQDVTHPEDLAADLAQVERLRAGAIDTFTLRKRYLRRDGTILWGELTVSVLRDAAGTPVHFISVVQDVTERVAAEARLAESEARLALASNAARLGVWDLDVAAGRATVNEEFSALYGLPSERRLIAVGDWQACIHPEDRARVIEHAQAAVADGGEYRDEFRILRADTGEERWVAARGRALGHGPHAARFIGVQYDVTARRLEQERQMLLAREVDHRAKNVLAVVRSIVKLTRAEDPRSFAEAVEGRVAALARAHTLLARDRWTGALLGDVVREELAAYGGGAQAQLSGPTLRLRPEAVQPLSMVLHELATNAAKYGALSVPGGKVTVTWRLLPASPDGAGSDPAAEPGPLLGIDWIERDGPPVPGPPQGRGFGSTVVQATVGSQLGGTVASTWDPTGLVCAIAIPGGRVLAPGAREGEVAAAPPAAPSPPREAGGTLAGRRVLVVEDEPLVALETAAVLRDLGCVVIGPAATFEEGLRLAEGGGLDAAVLDVNLLGVTSFPIADLLARRRVPVIQVTGYGTLPPGRGTEGTAAMLTKPLRDGELDAALRAALAGAATREDVPAA